MKKTTKRYLISSLVLSTAFCGLVGATQLKAAEADQTNSFAGFIMDADAEVRTTSPVGIRFVTNVPESVKEAAGENAQFGTLVIPKSKLTDVNEDQVIDGNDLERGGALVADIPTEKWLSEEKTEYAGVIVGQEDGEGNFTDLPESFYNEVLVARGYVLVDGEPVYTENYTEKSIAYVASCALASGDDQELLQDIVDVVVPSLAWAEDEVETAMLAEPVEIGLETDTKGLFVKFESKDEEIAKYENGKLYPVSEGTTTITASIGSTKATLDVKVGARQFAEGVLNDFLSTEDSGAGNWHGYATPTLVNLADKGLAAPTEADGYTGPLTKGTAIEWKINSSGQVSNWMNLYNFYENIDSYNPFDVVEIWLYMDMTECKADAKSTIYPTVAGAWGTDGSNNGGVALDNYYNNNGLPALQSWSKLSVRVVEIKAAMATNDIEYGGLGIALRPTVAASYGASVYLYSVEIHDGVVQDFTNATGFGYGGWAPGATPEVVELSGVGLSAPTTTDGYTGKVTKTTAMKYTAATGDGQSSPYLPMPGLFENIALLNDLDYISVWAYFDTTAAYTWTTLDLYAAGGTSWSSNANVHTGVVQKGTQGTLTAGKWIELKFTVATIKASMEAGETYKGLGLYITPSNALAKGEEIYYYVAEFHESENVELPNSLDLTNVTTAGFWATANAATVVDSPVGVPVDAISTNTKVISQTVRSNDKEFTLRIINDFFNLYFTCLSELDDNDIVGLWIYAEGDSSVTYNFKPSPITSNSVLGTNYYSFGTVTDTFTCGSWQRVDFTVAQMKTILAGLTSGARYDQLAFICSVASGSDASLVTGPIYMHSIEFVKAN